MAKANREFLLNWVRKVGISKTLQLLVHIILCKAWKILWPHPCSSIKITHVKNAVERRSKTVLEMLIYSNKRQIYLLCSHFAKNIEFWTEYSQQVYVKILDQQRLYGIVLMRNRLSWVGVVYWKSIKKDYKLKIRKKNQVWRQLRKAMMMLSPSNLGTLM